MEFAIKRMQNGSIGEARTKSFLIDRFWILERSVDVDGADFIVQVKLTEDDMLRDNLKFGRIQAKFVQDRNTPIKIKKRYFVDNDGNARLDFFLVVNTGMENDQRIYVLSSKDIQKKFRESLKSDDCICSAKDILVDEYLVSNKQLSLSRIENSIKCSNFYKNRTYIFANLDSVEPSFDSILPEYSEEIEHSIGRIPDLFRNQKVKAFKAIIELENIHNLLKGFIEAIDPVEAVFLAEHLKQSYPDNLVSLPEIFDKDFYYLLKNHREVVRKLKKEGILDNYIDARRVIIDRSKCFIDDQQYDPDETINHIVTVKYSPFSFVVSEVSNKLEFGEKQHEFHKFLNLDEGIISISYKIGLQGCKIGYFKVNEYCVDLIWKKMYELKYDEIIL